MSHHDRPLLLLSPIAAAALLLLAACGGGGGGTGPPTGPAPIGTPTPVASPTATPTSANPTPTPTPAPTATPTSNPFAVLVSPNVLSFQAVGPSVAGQSVAVMQASNVASFSLSTTNCAGIVSVSTLTGAGPFTFVPLAVGACSYVVTGVAGMSATIAISVETTTINNR